MSDRGVSLSYLQQEAAKRFGIPLQDYAMSVWRGSAWHCDRCGTEESIVGKVMEFPAGYDIRAITRDYILCYEEAEHAMTGCKGRLRWLGQPCV